MHSPNIFISCMENRKFQEKSWNGYYKERQRLTLSSHHKQHISDTRVLWESLSIQSARILTSVTAITVLTTSCPFSTTAPAVLKGQQPVRLHLLHQGDQWQKYHENNINVQWTENVFCWLRGKYIARKSLFIYLGHMWVQGRGHSLRWLLYFKKPVGEVAG